MPILSALARRDDTRATPAMRVLVAVPLLVSAYLHFDLAQGPLTGDGKVTLAGLFIGQSVVATLVTLWVLASGERLAVLAAAAVAIGSLAALVLSTYVKIPAIGPLPVIYEPIWYIEKVVAAAAAGAAALAAAAVLLRSRRR